jgi:hypothetical protein
MDIAPGANPFLTSPILWVALAGLFLGAALSRATMRTANRKDPDRARSRKWVFTCLYISLAVILGLLAVFIPGPSHILDIRLAWICGVLAAVAFCALRFKKAMGIPVFVLLLAVVIVFGLFLQSISAFTGETEIAAVRVISADAGAMRLELVPRGAQPISLAMKGSYFAPIVKVVIFNDLFVFMGARTWYRFVGMTSFDQNMRQQDSDFRFPHAMGISERLWGLFEENETRIPGVKTVQIEMTLKKAKEFATYGILIQNDGGVEIVPKSGS